MSVPLYYTSFLILAPALYGQGTLIGMLYTTMIGLSVLNHSKKHEEYPGKAVVECADKVVAHCLAGTLVWTAWHLEASLPLALFWWSLAYVVHNYYYSRRHILRSSACASDLDDTLARHHALFHAAAVFGGMCVLYAAKSPADSDSKQ